MTSKYLSQFSSPVTKLVRFFERSRDRWKAKHLVVQKSCKLLRNQTRAVEKSRESWRQRAVTAEARATELEHELEHLKFQC